ncbi:MAG: hypothetical protein V1740_02290 [Candidatus Woesearchaeota archaeon]
MPKQDKNQNQNSSPWSKPTIEERRRVLESVDMDGNRINVKEYERLDLQCLQMFILLVETRLR